MKLASASIEKNRKLTEMCTVSVIGVLPVLDAWPESALKSKLNPTLASEIPKAWTLTLAPPLRSKR